MPKPLRTWTDREFEQSRDAILVHTMIGLLDAINEVYEKLTYEEKVNLSIGCNPTTCDLKQSPDLLVRSLLIATGGDAIVKRWNSETVKPGVAQIKRIVKHRV